MYGGQNSVQVVELLSQFLHLTSGKIHLHFGFLHPIILEEEDDFGIKVDIFFTSWKLHELQEYFGVHGNHTRLLPVSMTKDNVCGGIPKLKEIE